MRSSETAQVYEAGAEDPSAVTVADADSGRVMSSRAPLIVPELDDAQVASSARRQSGSHSSVGVPLIAGDNMAGVLHATSYDPTSRRIVSASAGHPPWLHVGQVAAYVGRPDPPISPHLPYRRFSEHVVTLERHDLAVFSTDGLVEVRGPSLDEGLDRLRRVATELAGTEIESLSDELARAVSAGPRHDDLTLLALRAI